MGRRTSLWLTDDLDARVKASGLTLSELIRRGLHTLPGPPEPPAQVSGNGVLTVLLRIEDILKDLSGHFTDGETVEPLSEEEWEQQLAEMERQHAEAEQQRAAGWRDQLVAAATSRPDGEVVLTAADAGVLMKIRDDAARGRLRLLEAHGMARRADDDLGQGRAHRWRIVSS